MVISPIIRKFQIVVYHTLLKVVDSCAHLNVSGFIKPESNTQYIVIALFFLWLKRSILLDRALMLVQFI